MANGRAAGGTGEAAIRDQRAHFIHAAAHDQAGNHVHFPHTRAALGAFVPDDDDRARGDLPVRDCLAGILHAGKYLGLALKAVHTGLYAGLLDHGTGRCQAAVQYGQPALRLLGMGQREDHIVFLNGDILQVFGHGFAGAGQSAAFQQRLHHFHHGGHTAYGFQIREGMAAAGLDVAQIGHLAAQLIEIFQRKVNAGLVGNGGQMQGAVGGSAHGHAHGDGVAQGIAGHDLAGGQALFQHFHHPIAALLGDATLFGADRMGEAAAGQAHAQNFRQAAHGVGGAQHTAGANAGQGGLFGGHQFFHGHFAGLGLADQFPHIRKGHHRVILAGAGQHRAAGHHNGGNVAPHGTHQHTGNDLITAGQHHHGVKPMGFDHVFHRVGDQFPAGQGIAHALVPLADAIANGNGGEFPRYAAGLLYALRHALGQLPQVEVPGHHFRKRVYDGNERLVQVPLLQAGAVQQGTVGGTLNAVGQHSVATIFVMHGILHIVLVGHMEHSFAYGLVLLPSKRERSAPKSLGIEQNLPGAGNPGTLYLLSL